MSDTKIAVAVSGGIDSLITAHLLKEEGFDLVGLHFLTGFEKLNASTENPLQQLFQPMDIPVFVIDAKKQFKVKVVNYFAGEYKIGKTPNPCLVCNPVIKFDLLLKEAFGLGATRLATGHYARVVKEPTGLWSLRKGVDKGKDQSYFLSRLTQEHLAHACFPLGYWTKDRIRFLAAQKGLQPIVEKESQDICFIKDANYVDFLVARGDVITSRGDIVTTKGERIGTHNGLHRYTVGQRRGINCPASEAYYVVQIDGKHNRLVVGFKSDLYVDGCPVTEINWISDVPQKPIRARTRIRYRHGGAFSTVTPIGKKEAYVRFDEPQLAVTPGQGAVFYDGDRVLGGGWIDRR